MDELDRVISEAPSGIPGPDGSFRIGQAGRRQAAAYENYQTALKECRAAQDLG